MTIRLTADSPSDCERPPRQLRELWTGTNQTAALVRSARRLLSTFAWPPSPRHHYTSLAPSHVPVHRHLRRQQDHLRHGRRRRASPRPSTHSVSKHLLVQIVILTTSYLLSQCRLYAGELPSSVLRRASKGESWRGEGSELGVVSIACTGIASPGLPRLIAHLCMADIVPLRSPPQPVA